jgi:hypothetical protein
MLRFPPGNRAFDRDVGHVNGTGPIEHDSGF